MARPKYLIERINTAIETAKKADDWEIDVSGDGSDRSESVSYVGEDLVDALDEIPSSFRHTVKSKDYIMLEVRTMEKDVNVDTILYVKFCRP